MRSLRNNSENRDGLQESDGSAESAEGRTLERNTGR